MDPWGTLSTFQIFGRAYFLKRKKNTFSTYAQRAAFRNVLSFKRHKDCNFLCSNLTEKLGVTI